MTGGDELARVQQLMLAKFPQISQFGAYPGTEFVMFRITPVVISVLDCTKGFGHTELVTL